MARSFDGVNDKIVLGSTQSYWNFMHNTSALFTISIWCKLEAIDPNNLQNILLDNEASSANIGVFLLFDDRSGIPRDHKLIGQISNSVSAVVTGVTTDSFFPKDTNYHHVCVTYDQVPASLNWKFIMDGDTGNGETLNKTAQVPSNSDSTTAMHLGESAAGSFDSNMTVADLAIWNAVLSDSEITALSRGINPLSIRPTTLKAYYPLWGNQSPEPNYEQQLHTGTVTGAVKAPHPPTELP